MQAVDGLDGLAVLEGEQPDVIVTDINMPRMDGFGFIEEMRRGRHRANPILVLATESDGDIPGVAAAAILATGAWPSSWTWTPSPPGQGGSASF